MNDQEAAGWIASWPGQWRAETGASWAVLDEGRVVGQVGLRHVDLVEGAGNISYWVLPWARGYRVAPRALAAMTA